MLGATLLHLAAPDFTLRWTHSVERTDWIEDWTVAGDHLSLQRSAVRGSGAGMEPGPDAVLRDGWWMSPGGLEVPALHLAASGVTGGGWTLCADGTCRELGAAPGEPLHIAPCGEDAAD